MLYVIRYIDTNKSNFPPLQIKINDFLGNIHKLKNNIKLASIQSADKELFKKHREIWNRIIKMIGIIIANDFVKTTLDDGSKFIMVDVNENTSFVQGSNSDELVIVLHSVIDNDLKISLVQAKTAFSCLTTFNKFKTSKTYQEAYTLFFLQYIVKAFYL